ncbi:hypothetical protein LB506_007212 [Fusarium annulatum]|nr:hypothetical protein LB506_007212 [Fusarium annulatum]
MPVLAPYRGHVDDARRWDDEAHRIPSPRRKKQSDEQALRSEIRGTEEANGCDAYAYPISTSASR